MSDFVEVRSQASVGFGATPLDGKNCIRNLTANADLILFGENPSTYPTSANEQVVITLFDRPKDNGVIFVQSPWTFRYGPGPVIGLVGAKTRRLRSACRTDASPAWAHFDRPCAPRHSASSEAHRDASGPKLDQTSHLNPVAFSDTSHSFTITALS
jgi:hypothetical protein